MTTMRSTRISLSFNWDQLIGESRGSTRKPSEGENLKKLEGAVTTFCTGSRYKGDWDILGMSGLGAYTYPYPVRYEGEMFDGMFHGEGALTYPMGQKIQGLWHKGDLVNYRFFGRDGMEFSMDSTYCVMPNRTFYVPKYEDLQPAGEELLQKQVGRTVAAGCYDTTDGFFDPATRSIRLSCDPLEVDPGLNKRLSVFDMMAEEEEAEENALQNTVIISQDRANWIEEHCQHAWDTNVGYRPDLYEHWTIGRALEQMGLMESYENHAVKDTKTGSLNYAGTGRILLREHERQQQQETRRASVEQRDSKRESVEHDGLKRESIEESHGSKRSSVEQHGSKRSSTEHHGSKRSSNEQHGSRRSSVVRHGSRRSSVVKHGSKRLSDEHHESKKASIVN